MRTHGWCIDDARARAGTCAQIAQGRTASLGLPLDTAMDYHHWPCHLEISRQMLLEWRRFFAGSIALILVISLHQSTATARHVQVSPKMACRDIGTKNYTFLAFLPCLERIDNLNDTRSILEECDLLTRVAVGLAVDRLNQELTNYTLNIASLSHVSDSSHQSTNVS